MEPPPGDAVRRIAPADMHLTLHFLGRAETGVVSRALRPVRGTQLDIRLGRPGHFALRGRKTVLWIGVEPTPSLLALHTTLGAALGAAGFEPESRPYVPHITLARLGPKAPRDLVPAFERQATAGGPAGFTAERFALFASETAPEGARYRVLESFPLEPNPGGANP